MTQDEIDAFFYEDGVAEARKAKPVNCRTCKHWTKDLDYYDMCSRPPLEVRANGVCTNGDKFSPLPIVQLYRS